MKCLDCQEELGSDFEENEIIKCPICGLEIEVKKGLPVPLTIEGEDWGE